MSDVRFRELERAAAAGGVREAARLYLARVRVGEVPASRLQAAAILGHEAAQIALGEVREAPAPRVRIARLGKGRKLHGYQRPTAPNGREYPASVWGKHATPRQARSFCGRLLDTLGRKDPQGIPTCTRCLRSERMMRAYTESVCGPVDDVAVLDPVAGIRCALAAIAWAWEEDRESEVPFVLCSRLHAFNSSIDYVRAGCPQRWAFRPHIEGSVNYETGDINMTGPNPVVPAGQPAHIPYYHPRPVAWDPGGFADTGPDTWLTLLSNALAALWRDRYGGTNRTAGAGQSGAGYVARACLLRAISRSDEPGERCASLRDDLRGQVCPWLVGDDDPLEPPPEEATT